MGGGLVTGALKVGLVNRLILRQRRPCDIIDRLVTKPPKTGTAHGLACRKDVAGGHIAGLSVLGCDHMANRLGDP